MADTITTDMLDPATPEEVEIRLSAREPVWDSTMGIQVEPKVEVKGTPRHRIVAIGDSLTQGFQSGAIFNTDLSYPAMIAHELGWFRQFRRPQYQGFGGLPLNLEYIVRQMEEEFGEGTDWWEMPLALFRIRHLMDEVEDWWERGGGSRVPNIRGINHNLAVYGWDLRDTLERTSEISQREIQEPKDHAVQQIVENANERAAIRVLESARDETGAYLTPLEAAAALGKEGVEEAPADAPDKGDGIETLIVLLGANNALGAVAQLRVAWSGAGFDDLHRKRGYTVWRPAHFASEFDKVASQVEGIPARHVIWGNVPHVTIAPVARGVGAKMAPGSRYFPYYTRPWISDRHFDARNDPNITGPQARAIDSAIDQYNEHIATRVAAVRRSGKDWRLIDIAGLMDRLAARRYIEDPLARPDWWQPYPLPPELAALSPVPDSQFFTSDGSGRLSGGLFSLDGVHPTTIAYGILAQELCNIMSNAGVQFRQQDGVTARPGPINIDFRRLIALDTLISRPPASLTRSVTLIGWLDQRLDIFGRLFRLGA